MKRIITLVVCSLLLGCHSGVSDVSSLPGYRNIVGKKFITKMPLVVYEIPNDKENIYLSKDGSITGLLPLKEEKFDSFPFKRPGLVVKGILPLESEFEISNVMRTSSYTMGHDFMKVKVIQDGSFKGFILTPMGLEKIKDGAFTFDPACAEEVKE